MVGDARRRGVGQRLLQEGHALGETTGQRVRVAEMRGRDVKKEPRRDDPAELDGALERRDGLPEIAAAEGDEPEAPIGDDEAGRIIDLASDPNGLLGARPRLAELAQLGEAPDEPRERGMPAPARTSRLPSIALEPFRRPAKTLRGLSILPRRLPDPAEARFTTVWRVTSSSGDGESALAQFEGAVRVTPPQAQRASSAPAPVGARRPAPRRGPRPRGHGQCSSPARSPSRAPPASRWRSMACSVHARLSGRCRSASSAWSKLAAASR